MTAMKLTIQQERALQVLQEAGGTLDYQTEIYAFAAPGAGRKDRVQMATAKALVERGLAEASRIKELRGRQAIDQITLSGQ